MYHRTVTVEYPLSNHFNHEFVVIAFQTSSSIDYSRPELAPSAKRFTKALPTGTASAPHRLTRCSGVEMQSRPVGYCSRLIYHQ